MSSLAALVKSSGVLRLGSVGDDVRVAQLALSAAGFRVETDGIFGAGTASAVRRFQAQHGVMADGVIGLQTAQLLDQPHEALVAAAAAVAVPTPPGAAVFPHDDTASLLAFYGKPWEDASLLVDVAMPFRLTYDEGGGRVLIVTKVKFHKKAADRLLAAYAAIWDHYGHDLAALDATRFTKFSGSYNYRPIRGSSRLSCHAFGAAVDHDAEDNPLGSTHNTIPLGIVACFKAQGFFWGGDYIGRRDNMHFQAAHE